MGEYETAGVFPGHFERPAEDGTLLLLVLLSTHPLGRS